MKFKIEYTDDYMLMLFESYYVKVGQYIYVPHITNQVIRKIDMWGAARSHFRKIVIGHRPLKDAPYLENVPVLPPNSENFTKDDIRLIVKYVLEDAKNAVIWSDTYPKILAEDVESKLPMLRRPKWFECEIEVSVFEEKESLYEMVSDKYMKPKTRISEDGLKELVGTFTNQ